MLVEHFLKAVSEIHVNNHMAIIENFENVSTHLLAASRTVFNAFLVHHPGAGLLLVVGGLFCFGLQHQRLVKWRKRATTQEQARIEAQEESGRRYSVNQELSRDNKLLAEQLAYWDALFNCLDQQWAVVGRDSVRRVAHDTPAEVVQEQKYLGSKDNPFEPMPPERPKKPRNEADYEPAFILMCILAKGIFNVAVVRPADMKAFLNSSQAGSALVQVRPLGGNYLFDIPKSVPSTGAASLALEYVINYATREGILALEAPLTHTDDEDHRRRLCGFYARKFRFHYRAADGYITRSLQ